METGIKTNYTHISNTDTSGLHWITRYLVEQPIILVALAVGVRLSIINYPVWYDEAFTLWLVGLPAHSLIAATAGDVHPPLYYLTAWVFARILGVSVLSVRLVSLLFGVASLPVFGAILMPLHLSRRVKTLALWLAAVSPFLIAYSNEMRMYSLLLFIVLVAVCAVQRGNVWAFGISIALGMLTQNLMVLYVVPLFILFWYRAGFRRAVLSAVISVVLYAPWIPVLYHQLLAVQAAYWIPDITAGRVIAIIYEATAEIATNPQTLLITACVVLSLLVIGTWQAIRRKLWMILVLAWVPLVLGVLISFAFRPVLMSPPRPLIGSTPFLLVLVALGTVWLYEQLGKPVLALAIVPLVLVGNLYAHPFKAKPMVAGMNITGTCYHLSTAGAIVGAVYAPNCDHYVWRGVDNLAQSLSAETKAAMGFDFRRIEDIQPGNVWLFYADSPNTSNVATAERDRITGKYPVIAEYNNDKMGIISEHIYKININ